MSFTPYWCGGQHGSHPVQLSHVSEVVYPLLMPVIRSLSLSAVRLHSDRVSLIKECLCQSPTCYKQAAKLLGLAELLRVAGKFRMLNCRVRFLCYSHHYPGRTSECVCQAGFFSGKVGILQQCHVGLSVGLLECPLKIMPLRPCLRSHTPSFPPHSPGRSKSPTSLHARGGH